MVEFLDLGPRGRAEPGDDRGGVGNRTRNDFPDGFVGWVEAHGSTAFDNKAIEVEHGHGSLSARRPPVPRLRSDAPSDENNWLDKIPARDRDRPLADNAAGCRGRRRLERMRSPKPGWGCGSRRSNSGQSLIR